MKHTRVWAWALTPVLVLGVVTALSATSTPARADGITRQIPSGGTTSVKLVSTGSGAIDFPEFIGQPRAEGADAGAGAGEAAVNRSLTTGTGQGAPATPAATGKANVKLVRSFDGLNHRAQRTANGGNQFSIEPPDQGLCAGNGFVMEPINTVLRVFDTSGGAVTGVTDLNTFFGYPAQVNRTTGAIGPFITDPSCFFDTDTQRWFLVVLTLEVDPTSGAFLGPNHLDLAVRKTSPSAASPAILASPSTGSRSRTTAPRARPTTTVSWDPASATTRTSAPTPTASTSPPTSTRCSRRPGSTPRRSTPSPRPRWRRAPPTSR